LIDYIAAFPDLLCGLVHGRAPENVSLDALGESSRQEGCADKRERLIVW
jgi:hypothetical protein